MAMLKKGLSYRRQGSSGLIWADNMIVAEDGTLILNRHKNNNNGGLSNGLSIEKGIDAGGDGGLMRSAGPRVSDSSAAMMMSRSKSVGSASAMASSAADIVLIPSSSASSSVPVPATPSRPKSSFRVMKWIKRAITKIRR